jgi:hypothetical protein
LLERLQTPTAGTVAGALLILMGGIIYVSGSSSVGTLCSLAGFGLILKFRVLPARRAMGTTEGPPSPGLTDERRHADGDENSG